MNDDDGGAVGVFCGGKWVVLVGGAGDWRYEER